MFYEKYKLIERHRLLRQAAADARMHSFPRCTGTVIQQSVQ